MWAGDGFVVEHVVRGETIAEVLSRANHHSPDMLCRQEAGRWCGGVGLGWAEAAKRTRHATRQLGAPTNPSSSQIDAQQSCAACFLA